jgi:hypothetical protein
MAAMVAACGSSNGTSSQPEGDSGSDGGGMGDATTGDSSPDTSRPDSSSGDSSAMDSTTGGDAHDSASDAPADGDAAMEAGCAPPKKDCGGKCVDPGTDPFNCGTCNNACTGGLVCSSGSCVPNCTGGQTLCIVDGGGGIPDAAPADGSREAATDASADVEVDAEPEGGSTEGGSTDSGSTDSGTADAGAKDSGVAADGGSPSGAYCTTTATDPNNCGGCGIVCPAQHDTPSCTGSTCGVGTCDPGYANCDMSAKNGCETNTNGDPANCGSCGNVCTVANATPGCSSGNCTIQSCNPGFADCDMSAKNGCETDTNTDPSNCGKCGDVCNLSNANATCTGGKCEIASCAPGFADCDKNPANGCETNTNTSTGNCGSCGTACSPANATGACSNGTCGIAMCNSGFSDCDGNPANGCEVNDNTDPNNCGGCGIKCNLPNATATCNGGKCAIATCATGFSDCDGNPTNGCETSTGTDPANCGSCGHVCNLANATAGCSGGGCTVSSCNAGFQNCDNQPSNGCEINTNTDPANCGGCFHQCFVPNGTPGCGGGNCTVASCNGGYANCDGNVANGCEVQTTNDNNNCGSCGHACVPACGGAADHVNTTQCASSQCQVTSCAGGYQDFDGKCADGCECLDSSTQASCASAQSLFAGTLQPGQSITPFSSTMAPLTVTQAYFTLIFGGFANPSVHPKINITSPNNEFLMDITQDCSGTSEMHDVCGDNGANTSKAVTTWEVQFPASNNPVPGMDYYNPIPAVGAGGEVWIRVYRNPLVTPTCNLYTITASD